MEVLWNKCLMRFLIHSTATPAEDLALEEAIQTCVEDGLSPSTWRIWQAATPAVIIGTGQEAAKEVNLEVATHENVTVVRRHSGGGAVMIGPGVINYSAFYRFVELPGSETIRGAMSAALAPVVRALAAWKLEARESGLSDLAVIGTDGALRKIAGNAQARKRHSVAVHGTLLADPDWLLLERLLPFPSKVPDYRAGRGHRAFLTSLALLGAPPHIAAFGESLSAVLTYDMSIEVEPTLEEKSRVRRFLAEKYDNREWNFRR